MGLPKNVTPQDIRQKMLPFIEKLHRETEQRNQEALGIPADAEVTEDEIRVLKYLEECPFRIRTQIKENVAPKNYDSLLRSLQEKGYLSNQQICKKTNSANYYPLTEKAQDFLNIPQNLRISEKMFVHSLYMFWVRSWANNQGLDPIIEYGRQGIDGRIDVYCRKTGTAYEITRSFKNLCENAQKCLYSFKVKKLVVVCSVKDDCAKAQEILESCLTAEQLGKVSVEPTVDFLDNKKPPKKRKGGKKTCTKTTNSTNTTLSKIE